MSEQRILELEALVEQLEEDLYQDISISNELFEENQELKVKVRGLKLIAQELVEALEEATWLLEGYTERYEDNERLIKELIKAKEMLGHEA